MKSIGVVAVAVGVAVACPGDVPKGVGGVRTMLNQACRSVGLDAALQGLGVPRF